MNKNILKIMFCAVAILILYSGSCVSQNIDTSEVTEEKEDTLFGEVISETYYGIVKNVEQTDDHIEFDAIFVINKQMIEVPRGVYFKRNFYGGHQRIALDDFSGLVRNHFIMVSWSKY